ncbi:MAG: IPT/TIG domain-containing protein [Planctomycetota bacterium]
MIRHRFAASFLAVLSVAVCSAGCKSKHGGGSFSSTASATSTTTGGTNSGNGNGSGTGQTGPALTSVTPDKGNPYGGTAVTLLGRAFEAGSTVRFDGLAATAVVTSGNTITCLTPAHPAGMVDVEVVLPNGTPLRLNNAFTYDPSAGPFGRVMDSGNPTPEEHELLELLNRARRDPPAEGRRLNLDFSQIAARPPLTHDALLAKAAVGHSLDMAQRAFYGHLNPDGVGPVGRILDTGYALHSRYGTDRASNTTENVGAASGNLLGTPQQVHDAFMIDAGLAVPKHRELLLGIGNFKGRRQNGFGYRKGLQSAGPYSTFITEELAASSRDLPLILGTTYTDTTPDGLCRVGEARPNVTVTLTHSSGFSLSTTSNAVGAFAFEVYSKGAWTLTLDGKAQALTVGDDNIKVDLVNGAVRTY